MNKQELIKYFEDLPYVSVSQMGKKAFIDMIEQLDEPQKVTVPQFVADWIEYCKEHNFTLLGCLYPVDDFGTSLSEGFKGDTKKCVKWCRKESNTFALAWLFGYVVENEKKYLVKMKGVTSQTRTLKRNIDVEMWYFGNPTNYEDVNAHHTKEELEEANFGWVFSCEGVEVEEVEE